MIDTTCTTIDLLRHGEVLGGACYRGSKDDPLTEKGWQQMALVTAEKKWDVIISSPLCRCADFAQHLSANFITHDALKELHFGDWEGKTAEELMQHSADAFSLFMQNPENHPPPNGEKISAFRHRVLSQWRKIINEHKSKHILIINHGGTMRTIISHILNMPAKDMMRLYVPHASMSQVKIFHDNDNEKKKDYPSLVYHGKEANHA